MQSIAKTNADVRIFKQPFQEKWLFPYQYNTQLY